ncbi:unnamed protein product [Sphagnum jensenii]|uniref:Uncharacterized protein n=1 Tax=Sphagnum jensenii TaxID=128206 RepID=A0ABP0WT97_9BRYO
MLGRIIKAKERKIVGAIDDGMGEVDANDDEGLEVVEEGQVRPLRSTGNVPNWPQKPTPAKPIGLRGTKMPLGVPFEGVDLLDSY